MTTKNDIGYQVVYRGETLEHPKEGGWVFFQRNIEYGGGYWLGRTYENVFMIEYERPVSLNEGIQFILAIMAIERNSPTFDDDFELV
ncbi:hypothetical protein ACUNG9_04835 [Serratia sp. IR-2025]|nr:hypothetical protein [Serratia marcescens]